MDHLRAGCFRLQRSALREPPAQFGQFFHGGAWLFGVLESAVAGQRGQRVDCLRDSPAAVGIDPHRADPSAHRLDPSDILVKRLSRLGHFDLRGLGARESGQHLGTSAAVTAGTVALTGMRSRRGVGSARYAASMAADSHAEASAG